jgi:hypothetical protein
VWARPAVSGLLGDAVDHVWRHVGSAATRAGAQEIARHLVERAHAGRPIPELERGRPGWMP